MIGEKNGFTAQTSVVIKSVSCPVVIRETLSWNGMESLSSGLIFQYTNAIFK